MSIGRIISELEQESYLGSDKDDPEGSRYVKISETALRELIHELRTSCVEPADARQAKGKYWKPDISEVQGHAI